MKKVFVMQQFLKGITSVINKLEFIWFLVFCGIFLLGFLIFYCTAKTVQLQQWRRGGIVRHDKRQNWKKKIGHSL